MMHCQKSGVSLKNKLFSLHGSIKFSSLKQFALQYFQPCSAQAYPLKIMTQWKIVEKIPKCPCKNTDANVEEEAISELDSSNETDDVIDI